MNSPTRINQIFHICYADFEQDLERVLRSWNTVETSIDKCQSQSTDHHSPVSDRFWQLLSSLTKSYRLFTAYHIFSRGLLIPIASTGGALVDALPKLKVRVIRYVDSHLENASVVKRQSLYETSTWKDCWM